MLTILLESAARSIAIAIVLGAVLRLMSVRNQQTLSIVWTAVLLSAVTMPLLMPAVEAIMASVPPETVAWIPNASSPFVLRPLTSGTADNSISFVEGATTIVLTIYAIVAAVALFRIGVGVLKGYRLRRVAVRLNEAWASGWDIRASTQLAVPVTYGRTVLLPAEWPNWSDFKRDAVLVHETSHVVRRDFYVQLLAGVHRAVFWFSPLAWWLQDQLLKASENLCDDKAIEKVGDRISYAELLLDFTKLRSNDRLMGVAMARGKTVESRVERILQETRITPRLSVARRVLMIGAIVPLVGLAAGSWLVKAETEALPMYTAAPLPAAVLQQTSPTPAPVQVEARTLAGWIEEDVPDLSTAEEQAAFKALQTDQEREAFIEQFWRRRDPTPGTPANEFRDEYYRRIVLANQRYSTASIQGYKTDRGRILVRFGEADEVETHTLGGTYLQPDGARTQTFPFEKWRYRAIQGIGQNIILEFVDVGGNGTYRLTYDVPVGGGGQGGGGGTGGRGARGRGQQ
jgi:GWxTD domain-containing protein